MRLKKLFLLVVAMVMAIPTMFAADKLQVARFQGNYAGYKTEITPNSDDLELTFNSATNQYEGMITNWKVSSSVTYQAVKLYSTSDSGTVTYYGYVNPNTGMAAYGKCTFAQGTSYSFAMTANSNSTEVGAYAVTSAPGLTYNSEEGANVNVTVDATLKNVTFTLVTDDPEGPKNPDKIYLWSTKNGANYSYSSDLYLSQSSSDENVYEGTFDIPYYTGMMDAEGGDIEDGYYFFFSPDTKLAARMSKYLCSIKNNGDETIEFTQPNQTITMQVAANGEVTDVTTGSNFHQVTPGKTKYTLDIKQLTLTAQYLESEVIVPEQPEEPEQPKEGETPAKLFIATSTSQYSTGTPTAGDPEMTYDEATNSFKYTMDMYTSTNGPRSVIFYAGTPESPTLYGATASKTGPAPIDFRFSNEYTNSNLKLGNIGGLSISYPPYGAIAASWSGEVEITVTFPKEGETGNITAEFVNKTEFAPENLYAWAYVNKTWTLFGDQNGVMTETSKGSNVYEKTVEITAADIADSGFGFIFSPYDNATYRSYGVVGYGAENITLNVGASKTFDLSLSSSKTIISNAGRYTLSIDWATKQLTVTRLAPLPTELYGKFTQGGYGSFKQDVIAPEASDIVLTMTESGIYEGTFNWMKYATTNYNYLRFYSFAGDEVTYYEGTAAQQAVRFQTTNPTTATIVTTTDPASTDGSAWYLFNVDSNAALTLAEVKATVNLNTNQVVFNKLSAVEPKPEVLYLKVDDKGTGSLTSVEMKPSATDPDVYEVEYDVPAVYTEEGEGGNTTTSENNLGLKFFVSKNFSTSATGNYVPAEDNENIVFQSYSKEYKATWVAGNGNALAMTPGKTMFRFNYKTLEIEMEYLEELPNELEIKFTGENFTLGSDINEYLTITDMYAMIMSGGANDGVIDINSNPYVYKYAEGQSDLQFTIEPKDGYSIEMSLSNVSEGAQIDLQGGNGNWMLAGKNIGTGIVANVSITQLPSTITLDFTGCENAYEHLTVINIDETEEVDVNANPFDYTYQGRAALSLTAEEGYEITTIECVTEGADVSNYQIASIDMDGATQWTLGASNKADGYKFQIVVAKVNSVTFNFTGLADAYNHVDVVNPATGVQVNPTEPEYVLTYGNQGGLNFAAKAGYEIKSITCVTDNAVDENYGIVSNSTEDGTQWVVSVDADADGYEFDVEIVKVNSVTFNFTGLDDAYNHVDVINMSTMEQVNPIEPEYVLTYGDQGGLNIAAKEGYTILSVECVTDSETEGTAYGIAPNSTENGEQWTVSVTPAADGYEFEVTVAKQYSLEFTFTGSNFTPEQNINAYVTVTDNSALIGSEGADTGKLTIDTNPYTYIYSKYSPKQTDLYFTPQFGYSIEDITYDASEYPDAKIAIQGGETGVWQVAALETVDVPISVTLVKDPNKAVFNFTGVEDAYTHVRGVDFETFEEVTFDSNKYVVEFDKMGGFMSLIGKEGYTIDVVCATEGAVENVDYQIQGQNSELGISYTVVAMVNGLEFTVTVSTETEVPEDGVRFVFTGVEDGWKLFRMMDMLSEDGDDIDITGNIVDFTFEGMAGLMLGFKQDVNAEEYVWTLTCEDGEGGQGIYLLDEGGIMESQHGQKMLLLWQGAYGYTFTIDISKIKTVDFVITGTMDEEFGTAQAFKLLTVEAQQYTEDFDPVGELTTIYFDGPDYTYSFTGYATWALVPSEGYMIKSVTAEGNPGGDTFMYDPDTNEIALYEGGYTITITLMSDDEDGIANIYDLDGAEGYTVVNMQGTVLLRNGSAADLNLLEKGMYIVNGKKIVISK